MDAKCLQCGTMFTREPNQLRGTKTKSPQRFCSKPCWYAWHKGTNNAQTITRVDVVCNYCGITFSKQPKRVGKLNYCTGRCSRAAHGEKLKGAKSPSYRGGPLSHRGAAWWRTRLMVIMRQDGRCLDCGMTDEAHKAKYKRSLDVHHRKPYRLSLDNSDDNLVAVCKKCHGIEEVATRRGLSPEDIALMRKRTEADLAKGFFVNTSEHLYDLCPICKERKAKKAKLCRRCDSEKQRRANPNRWCPRCGGPKKLLTAKQCRSCDNALRKEKSRLARLAKTYSKE